MADRKVEVDTTGSASENITPEERRRARKARLAGVYERGVVGDRLHVELPPSLHGEWVPNSNVDIQRKEALGFRIDTEYAPKRALHDKGDGASYVGDCVFMVCDREDKEIIDEIRRERYEATHNPKRGTQKEERDFVGQAGDINAPTAESKVREARKEDISAALSAAAKPTQ